MELIPKTGAATCIWVRDCPDNLDSIRDAFGAHVLWHLDSGTLESLVGSVESLPEDTPDSSLFHRLAFFSEPQHLNYLIAPLLMLQVWKMRRENIVVAYPGVSIDCLLAAQQMLAAGCETVLLRSNAQAPIVLGVTHNPLIERMLIHWADRIERCSLNPDGPESFDSLLGTEMFEYICDKIGLLRDTWPQRIGTNASAVSENTTVASVLVRAAAKLLPASPELIQDPSGNLMSVLNAASPEVAQDAENLITNLAYFIWGERVDLRSSFDLTTADGRHRLVDWFLGRVQIEYDIDNQLLQPIRSARDLELDSATSNEESGEAAFEIPVLAGSRIDPARGVNLIGYPRAEMGMGQQLRLCAASLSAVNLGFSIVDFTFGIVASHKDSQLEQIADAGNPYDVNVFHINADQIPLVRDKLGSELFRNRYNVGYWEWELSRFPDAWKQSIDLMDEIWAPSKFIQAALAEKTAKPVIWMPLGMEITAMSELLAPAAVREKMKLPPSSFLFLFAFDFSSLVARKNFPACISAFRKAFPENDSNVGLVIKTIHHAHQDRDFWDLLRSIGDDKRIHLIDRILRRQEMHELTAACDCFVSLHRSEGFGLGIAEAMFLGKPVITTNYSGNTDFTKEDNSCLVDYKLVPVGPNEYLYPDGQVWAEPDVEQAAEHMRRLAGDQNCASRIGQAGGSFIRQHHSFETVGNRYRMRLAQIAQARSLLAAHPIPLDLASAWRYR